MTENFTWHIFYATNYIIYFKKSQVKTIFAL